MFKGLWVKCKVGAISHLQHLLGVICPPACSHPSVSFQFLQCSLHSSLTLLFLR